MSKLRYWHAALSVVAGLAFAAAGTWADALQWEYGYPLYVDATVTQRTIGGLLGVARFWSGMLATLLPVVAIWIGVLVAYHRAKASQS